MFEKSDVNIVERWRSVKRPAVRMKVDRKKNFDLFGSFIGGYPAWPVGMEDCSDYFGEEVVFLAQIKCSDVVGIDDFPKRGLLQFFMNGRDVMGDGFVLWHQSNDFVVLDGRRDFGEEKIRATFDPFLDEQAQHMLVMENFEMKMSPFESYFFENMNCEEKESSLEDIEKEWEFAGGHYIGGFPSSSQGNIEFEENECVLIRFDSDFESGMLWGDSGSSHFIIKKDDLKKKDFSKVRFSWDCY